MHTLYTWNINEHLHMYTCTMYCTSIQMYHPSTANKAGSDQLVQRGVVHTYMYMYVCMFSVLLYMYMHTYMYIYMYSYVHTCEMCEKSC